MSLDWSNIMSLVINGISTIAIWELMKYMIRKNREINLVDDELEKSEKEVEVRK